METKFGESKVKDLDTELINQSRNRISFYENEIVRLEAEFGEPIVSNIINVEKIKRGQTMIKNAKNRLFNAKLRLVVSIAKKYNNHGLNFFSAVKLGNIGLIKAIEKFDYHKGFKFSPYVLFWIRLSISWYISDQTRTVNIPVYMIEQINKVVRDVRQLIQVLGREPTDEEIAKKLGWDDQHVKSVKNVPHEQEVFKMRFGLNDDYSLTLEEVGLFLVSKFKDRLQKNVSCS